MNPWHNSRVLNLVANMLFAGSLLAILATAAAWVAQRPMFQLRHVDVEPAPGLALDHAPSVQLRHAALRSAQGGFFTVDLNAVRAAFEAVPWVRRASVRRIWPDRLIVDIEEHRPMAIWGGERLVNGYGEVFTANVGEAEEDGPLPELAGPDGSEGAVVRRYEELKIWLSALGRVPQQVELSSRHAWTVTLDDGTKLLLGRDQGLPIEDRVKRFAQVFPRVASRLDRKAEVVDLRYPNGFAIRSVDLVTAEGSAAVAAARKGNLVARLNNR